MYQAIGGTDNRKSLVLDVPSRPLDNFPAFFNAFLEAIHRQTDLESFKKSEFIYDLSNFIQLLA